MRPHNKSLKDIPRLQIDASGNSRYFANKVIY